MGRAISRGVLGVLLAIVGGVAPGGAGAMVAEAPSQAAKKATFVLVHPAWHGAWCWKKVIPLLRAHGHDVHAPTLTGLGERAHLAHPMVGLDTHVQDVVNVLEYEDLRSVVLVGHSNGGTLITAVADRVPDRLAHLVYLDAFVPEDGQATIDLITFPAGMGGASAHRGPRMAHTKLAARALGGLRAGCLARDRRD